MRRFLDDDSRSARPAGEPFDQLAHARTERLLRDAHNAAALSHRLALLDIEARHRLDLHRSHFNPNQPRVPAGHPDGGQWTSEDGGNPGSEQRVMSDVTPENDWQSGAQYASKSGGQRPSNRTRQPSGEAEPGQAARLAIAEARAQNAFARLRELDPNWRPQLGAQNTVEGAIRAYETETVRAEARLRELTRYQTEPIVPKQRPGTPKERNDIAREIAKWLVRNYGRVVEGVAWLREYEAAINAYLDPPKSLEELQQAAASGRKPGYQIHHIVEQKSAEDDKFPRSIIDAPENLVQIPTYKHWEINGWFGRPDSLFGDKSPRDYLRGRDWDERLKVGLDALIQHKVLKP
jgi:hypothetical protein